MQKLIQQAIGNHRQALDALENKLQDKIAEAAELMVETLRSGHKILFCGNGGSAADAQHLAAEISGRFVTERRGLAGLALTTDTSVLTSVGNDYGFEYIFARQVQALATAGDILVGISTSGNSPNVLKAFEAARSAECKTIGLSGKDGGRFNGSCEVHLCVPAEETARIQEMHILIGHILCAAIDAAEI